MMNEYIRELAEHCDFYVGNEHHDKSHEEQQRLWAEKFAELIVGECADFIEQDQGAGEVLSNRLKKHFGVE